MNGNPLIGIKEAIWVFVVVFGLSWFGPSPSVDAVSPPPEAAIPMVNFRRAANVWAAVKSPGSVRPRGSRRRKT